MFRALNFLLLLFFFSISIANPNVVFQPDFSGSPIHLPKNTSIIPLCNHPLDPSCMGQWSYQAIPLAVTGPGTGMIPAMDLFVPSFIPLKVVSESIVDDEDWETYTLPSFSSSRRRYRSKRKSDRGKTKIQTETPEISKGKTPPAKSSEEPEEDVEKPSLVKKTKKSETPPAKSSEKPEKEVEKPSLVKKTKKPETPPAKSSEKPEKEVEKPSLVKKTKKPKILEESSEAPKGKALVNERGKESQPTAKSSVETQEIQRVFQFNTKDPNQARVIETDKDGNTKVITGQFAYVSSNDIQQTDKEKQKTVPDQKASEEVLPVVSLETNRDTIALPATTKEVQPGCFVIDKMEETEAGFCFECHRDSGEDSVLPSLIDNRAGFVGSLKKYLRKVSAEAKSKVASKTLSISDSITKICSPEVSLKDIIRNFNESCPRPYKGDFKKFFRQAYCESCKKGIPPEIMMAMMSIESAGRCTAKLSNVRETSTGLFQVNAKDHQCRDQAGKVYQKGTSGNLKCFKDPINNMNKSIEILFNNYGEVNAKSPNRSQCKSWLNMKNKERDSWRRGVSAYNSQPGWVTRAIQSVYDKEILTTGSTSKLEWTHKKADSEYAEHSDSWEKLRAYYFIEKLFQGVEISNIEERCEDDSNKVQEGGTGRRLSCTISNIAHTEAVLGRNVKGTPPGMVEIWSQYIRNNKPDCK